MNGTTRIVAGAEDDAGHVCVWELGDLGWENTLITQDPYGSSNGFGAAVRTIEDLILVGAPGLYGKGQVFIYREIGESWTKVQVLGDQSRARARFGESIAVTDIDGVIWLAVGAPEYPYGAYVELYRDGGGTFTYEQTLRVSDYLTWFGKGVAFVGDRLVVASRYEVDGPRAWVFDLVDGYWEATAVVEGTGAGFGSALASDGARLYIGAPQTYTEGGRESGLVRIVDLSSISPFPSGDFDGDDALTQADLDALITYFFTGGPAPFGNADANDDEVLSVADIHSLIDQLY